MPWKISDVDSHKKGLSDEQKAKWVATANATLAECIKKGGTDEGCAPKAIRIANGITGNMVHYSVCIDRQMPNYSIKETVHQGKKYYVVPVVMMVEGVHHGSHGKMLQTISELGKFPEAWNGIPVMIDHPEIGGNYVSANDPDIIEHQSVGKVYNTHVDGKRLKAEAWIDVEKLQELSAELVEQFKKGELVEVSLGMFSEEEVVTGDWDGETYEAIAKGHRPDHLALLPGGRGACSVADGCGVRVNKEGDTDVAFNINGDKLITIIKKEVKKMADSMSCTPCIKEKVDALIANSQGKYTEDDRAVLETLSETFLDKISQPVEVIKTVPVEVEKLVEVNTLSDEDKAIIADYKQKKIDRRNELIKTIQTNLGKDTWTDEVLGGMKDDVLEKVVKLIKKDVPTDYSLQGDPNLTAHESTEEPLPPTGVNFK
jgi:FtsZ-binding cell division protein ZapB